MFYGLLIPKWSIILGSYSMLLIMNSYIIYTFHFSALNFAINVQLKEHEEAILDVCQRLNPDHYSWRKFTKELGIFTADIERMYTQEPTERFYCSLLEWIKLKRMKLQFITF